MPTRPTTQAGHSAALHPRLRAACDAGIAEYVRLYPSRPRPFYHSTWRPQLDCRTVAGACADHSLHSISGGVSRAADIDSATWSKTRDPQGHAADLARLIRRADPCVRWGASYNDFPHFDLPASCDGVGALVTDATGRVFRVIPAGLQEAADRLAGRAGVPVAAVYAGAGLAAAFLLARSLN